MTTDCLIYRCSKQDEMYLYVRAGVAVESLPPALRQLTGRLTQVMALSLGPQRKLARADVQKVMQQLESDGYYLQMPPEGHIKAHLDFGD
ncbi:MAG: YcgL domain-containing protein [Gammaproteobacteria bacterium]|nr:YcgL domain-containing protein [Gammaproteobacteria bacterium]